MVSRTENVCLPFESTSAAGVGSISTSAEAGATLLSSDKLNPLGTGLVGMLLTGIDEADCEEVISASGIVVAAEIEPTAVSA